MKDEKFIQLALQLAEKGRGKTSPNPLVGAVVVRGNKILAQGYHQKFGGPHAEAVALNKCGDHARGATLYINLEPCCHYGKTPPCTDLIIRSGIKRVVCSTIDSNPQVNGKGIERLRKAGIEVSVGILEQEARKLNEVYFKYITTKLPFVVLKVVATLDGKIIQPSGFAKLQRRANSLAHENSVPAGIDAILWDAGKVNDYNLKQDTTCAFIFDSKLPPHPRRWQDFQPIPLPIGERVKLWNGISSKLRTIKHTDFILVTFDDGAKETEKESKFKIWKMKKRKNGELDLLWFLKRLGEKGITSLLVEGGNKILTSFLKRKFAGSMGLVDKIWYQIVTDISGKGEEPFGNLGIKKISDAIVLKNCDVKQIKNSLAVAGYPF
jgi:diaminohydroxyphosphoribosylaminopyrimidine deaminase/5-amino-6-(5-phosphoribosylamino)uracil reductase